jgi:hypothetical protein
MAAERVWQPVGLPAFISTQASTRWRRGNATVPVLRRVRSGLRDYPFVELGRLAVVISGRPLSMWPSRWRFPFSILPDHPAIAKNLTDTGREPFVNRI